MKNNKLQMLLLIIVALGALLFMSTGLIVDIKWFQEVGYLDVFFTKVVAIGKILVPVFLIYFIVMMLMLTV